MRISKIELVKKFIIALIVALFPLMFSSIAAGSIPINIQIDLEMEDDKDYIYTLAGTHKIRYRVYPRIS